MNILVAPDKFKGSLSAWEVCQAVEEGVLQYNSSYQVTAIPLADGGEGTLEILHRYLDLQAVEVEVCDPLSRPILASYSLSGSTAYIEMAAASGLDLLKPEEQNCLYTTSFGTGQLVADAYSRGAREFYLFIGGSATNDGGIGFLKALGISPMQGNSHLLPIGENLLNITDFQQAGEIAANESIHFNVVCDVKNPLYGPNGASYVYGPQKGANSEAVEILDQGLRNLAEVVMQKRQIDIAHFEGSGAAGGIAAGISAFFPTTIRSGIDTVMNMVDLTQAIANADLVISGEGKLDGQTLEGKVISGVLGLCKVHDKPLGIICGVIELDDTKLETLGFWRAVSLVGEEIDQQLAMSQGSGIVKLKAIQLMEAADETGLFK